MSSTVSTQTRPTAKEPFEYQSVEVLKGVGPGVAAKLEKLGVYRVQDLLFHLPLRYEDRTRVVPMGALQHGQHAVVEGVIEHAEVRYGGKRRGGRGGRSLLCHVADGTGSILLRFFYFNSTQQANLTAGVRVRCYGEARFNNHRIEMVHPEYRRLLDAQAAAVEETMTPVYAKTEGVHQALLRNLIDQVLNRLNGERLQEYVPDVLLKKHGFPNLLQAIQMLHHPSPDTSLEQLEQCKHPAQQRMIFEELLAHQLSLMSVRQRVKKEEAVPLPLDVTQLDVFKRRLDFDLTQAQQTVIAEILHDMAKASPMMRLLQGDVGSGKTVVAACAVLAASGSKKQAAIMAPTEILAEQLFENFCHWFSAKDCVLLTGKDKGRLRQSKLEAIKEAKVHVIVGTHALFQEDVEFKELSLIIVDEQHRFGVHQRLALKDKGRFDGSIPHQLIMTATPIPRSLAMTAYADLDYSVIDALPSGRKPVSTVVVSEQRRQEVLGRVAGACASGEQAYWVCTLVEESEALQCQAAEETASLLQQALPELSIGLVHGRMKQQQKNEVVDHFKQGDINLLVATTVIEVGVDVPNASLMVIENAERLGLAQLHQLRGRVGRGEKQSACVLMYSSPLSERGKQRLAILRETNSGFVIAQKDLEMRGPGELLGTRQTGLMQMRIADIVRDESWLNEVSAASRYILHNHLDRVKPLIRRWLGLADRYGAV
jgi:ATP-dependent DNA helicase RecG